MPGLCFRLFIYDIGEGYEIILFSIISYIIYHIWYGHNNTVNTLWIMVIIMVAYLNGNCMVDNYWMDFFINWAILIY